MPDLDALEAELIAVINRHVEQCGLHPQQAALVLTRMTVEILGCLAWQPPSVLEAVKSAKATARHLAP